jgi:hypothetical protein
VVRFIILSFVLLLCHCQSSFDNRIKIARVYDDYLYLDQLPVVETFSGNDSLIFIQNFTNNWASQRLLFNKAQFNFPEYPSYIDSLVQDYKESLIIHYYQQAVIENYLDTLVSHKEIESYYQNNIDNFTLKEHILKMNYIKIKSVAPNLDFVKNTYKSLNLLDIELLEDYCLQFAERFFLNDTNWIDVFSLNKQLPFLTQDISLYNKYMFDNNRSIELKDKDYNYFIFIKKYKLKGSSAPLEYVSSMIQKILINKRKKDVLTNIEDMIIKEAIANNNFEVL